MPRLTEAQAKLRRDRILDAAGWRFARDGFHRTTMQDICEAAGVSPGALYLYFDSKEALIEGLVERDRAEVAADFAAVEASEDVLGAFAALGRRHLIEEPRERAAVVLAIWGEAARNARVRATCLSIETDLKRHLSRIFERARARMAEQGAPVAPAAILPAFADLFLALADGLIKRRALEEDFDASDSVDAVMAVLEAALSGRIAWPEPSRDASPKNASPESASPKPALPQPLARPARVPRHATPAGAAQTTESVA